MWILVVNMCIKLMWVMLINKKIVDLTIYRQLLTLNPQKLWITFSDAGKCKKYRIYGEKVENVDNFVDNCGFNMYKS